MNIKSIVSIITFSAFTFSIQAQPSTVKKVEGTSIKILLEQKVQQQLEEEKNDPTLSKTRPGRIAGKEEKKEIKKKKTAKQKQVTSSLKVKRIEKTKTPVVKKEKLVDKKN